MTQIVTAVFHDEAKVANAIHGLVERSVPLDEVSVVVHDRQGEHEVPIHEEMGATRGALRGGTIGAVLGGVGAALSAAGVVVAAPVTGMLAAGPALAILQGLVAGAGIGEAVGALVTLGDWEDEADLHAEDLKRGAALVAVHSDDLHDVARDVFEEAGADAISG